MFSLVARCHAWYGRAKYTSRPRLVSRKANRANSFPLSAVSVRRGRSPCRANARTVPASRRRPARYDYEYRRNGVANLFMLFEPLAGKRRVKVTARRTKTDWALCVREVVDRTYPEAERVVLVMDNLNTHTPVSLYEAFEPTEAKRIADRALFIQRRHRHKKTQRLGASAAGHLRAALLSVCGK